MDLSERPGLIDVHAHFVPDDYRAAATAAGQEHPDGFVRSSIAGRLLGLLRL